MAFLRHNGLTLALMSAFALSLVGMLLSGWHVSNDELARHGMATITLWQYFLGHEFNAALFENWESEFLQMAFYVVLTALLFQRGSAESKDPDSDEEDAKDPDPNKITHKSPWPLRAGGVWLWLYSYSLGLALIALFTMSFVLHWLHSAAAANSEALMHGGSTQSALEYLGSAELWFESFQNWQSEFLSTATIVILSIVLRFRNSPESKRVDAFHSDTGR